MSPMLLNAQANKPASTSGANGAAVLQSKLVAPKAINGSASEGTPTHALRVSTGVTAPKLISKTDILTENNWISSVTHRDETAIVSMIVDASGKPTDVKVVRAVSSVAADKLIEAVSQYRFQPGTLDNAPTAIPLNLEITLHHSGL